MKTTATPLEKFEGWFIKAIDKLKELPEGDGAFAAPDWASELFQSINCFPIIPTAKPRTAPSAGIQCFLIFDCGAMS